MTATATANTSNSSKEPSTTANVTTARTSSKNPPDAFTWPAAAAINSATSAVTSGNTLIPAKTPNNNPFLPKPLSVVVVKYRCVTVKYAVIGVARSFVGFWMIGVVVVVSMGVSVVKGVSVRRIVVIVVLWWLCLRQWYFLRSYV